MPTPRRVDLLRLGPLALVAAGALLLLVGAGGTSSRTRTLSAPASAWRGLVGQRPPVAVGQRVIVVLKAPSLAQRVAQAGGRASDSQERTWTAGAIAAQRQVLATLGTYGIQTRVEFSFARVLNGFSAALDAQAVALLERNPDVAGVYPVRVAYPASTSSELLARKGLAQGAGSRPEILLPGFDGRGVTIALLDTGVDRAHPYLRGRILDGIDVIGESFGALPRAKPDEPARLEQHGTEMAGILVGAGGPAGLGGVATGASVLPIRVAGWQQDLTGSWAVYARTDQLIAGLERAVDPNVDGDAHDAARIALVPLAAPYAAFADAPEARAVEGALNLDTLVVTAAGNDGPAGPGYGSVSSPGAAPAALTVGAVDLRRKAEEVRVVVRSGLRLFADRVVPLAGAVVATKRVELELAAPGEGRGGAGRPAGGSLPPPSLDDFFDAHGRNLVAGRAALVPTRGDPELAAENAARAGATAVVLYGREVPAGALGLDENVSVPVVSIGRDAAAAALEAIERGERVGVSIGGPQVVANGAAGRVAPFSSRGLAFDSRVKPDLAAPGVAITTADAGTNEDGSPRYATVNGSSAAAASVAGAAALLAQARPGLDAREIRSALAGYARPLPAQAVTAQGSGLLDIGSAAAAEVVADPTTLAFGRAPTAKWRARQTIVLHNISTRSLRLSIRGEEGGAGLVITSRPGRLRLRPGGAARVVLSASVRGELSPAGLAQGAVVVSPRASTPLRIPWTVMLGPRPASLLTGVTLSATSFRPSDTTPTVLTFRAGKLLNDAQGFAIQPVARLDVGLVDEEGKSRGLLARLRDLLPGRYALGLTGRDPSGNTLEAGVYTLRLVAVPPDNSRATRRVVRLTIR